MDPRDPLNPRCLVPEEPVEVGKGSDRAQRLAGKFAAEEAVLKAMGTGFGAGVAFSNVVIHRAAGAPPQVQLTGSAAKATAERKITARQRGISQTGAMESASAIAIGSATRETDNDRC